jgi:epoxide hydrolase-like predicted phosphatase
MIKLIIFDIGDVLINFNDAQYIRYVTRKHHIDSEEFKRSLNPLVKKMEYGASTLQETEKTLAKKFKISKMSLEWNTSYRKIARLNKPVFELVNRLSKRYAIALLSNVGQDRYIEGRGLLDGIHADKVFASCYIKMRKPEARIYRYALKKMGVKPSEAVFIDNMEENVVGARKVGIKSIRFTNYRALVKDLKRLKIIGQKN